MTRQIKWFLLILVLILVAGCESKATPSAEPVAPSSETETTAAALEIVGFTEAKSFTMDEIKALPAVEGWGGGKSSTGRISPPELHKGVTLQELCAQVGGLEPGMGVNAVAKDGYAMTFSYDQITNGDFVTYNPGTGDENTIDDTLQVIIAYERNGQPIPENEDGPLRVAIVSPKNNQVVDGHWLIKWVTEINTKSLAEDWTLQLEGALSEAMDRATFESCAAANCHQATWTDEKAQVWSGVPLWLLAGRIDDENRHEGNAYLGDLADQGYTLELVAADGYSVPIKSARFDRNDNVLVAYLVNDNPLLEKHFPLRLVGSELDKSEQVGQIAQIIAHLPDAVAEPPPTPEPAKAPAPAPPTGESALTITGAVEQEQTLSLEALKSLNIVDITAEHPKKGEQTNTGVLLNALLDLAGVKPEATKLIVTASDGYESEMQLAGVRACADCLLAFTNSDTLKLVMPGMDSGFWVKDIVQIEIK